MFQIHMIIFVNYNGYHSSVLQDSFIYVYFECLTMHMFPIAHDWKCNATHVLNQFS